jgi:polysaccharide chain length determinant protein (PEP-CTERM system associated)
MALREFLYQAAPELRRLWQHRWLGVAVVLTVAMVGAFVVSVVENKYEANARVFVDTQTVLKPLMAGLAFQPDVDQQVRMLARTLISRPNVERLMNSREIGFAKPSDAQYDHAVEKLKDGIKILPSGGGNIYTISYRDSNSQRARRLVQELVELFVDSNIDAKRRDSAEASRFLEQQIREYEVKLLESESKLKDFKVRNFGVSGVSNDDFFTRVSSLADVVTKLRLDLSAAEKARDAMRHELDQEDPRLPAYATPSLIGQQTIASELDVRLETQRKQLDELLRRFTESHPDVVSARRTIASLEHERREAVAAAKSTESAQIGGTAPTNPVYQKLRISLAEAEANVAALRTQLGGQQARLEAVRSTASRIPVVEAELAQLNRDYDVIRKNYDQLVSRREAASFGVKIDQSSPVAEFRVIEPAQVSTGAVFPSRAVLAALVVVSALACGAGSAFLASRLLPTVDDVKTLRDLAGRPVLGTVLPVVTIETRRAARKQQSAFGMALGAFLLTSASWVTWIALS